MSSINITPADSSELKGSSPTNVEATKPGVYKAFDLLFQELEGLNVGINNIADRINPILRIDDQESVLTADQANYSSCGIAATIEDAARRVYFINVFLNNIYSRIDL